MQFEECQEDFRTGAQFPGRRVTMGAPNHCSGRRMAVGGIVPRPEILAEKSQYYHKYFLQYTTFASERPQFRTWGRHQPRYAPASGRDNFKLHDLKLAFCNLESSCTITYHLHLNCTQLVCHSQSGP